MIRLATSALLGWLLSSIAISVEARGAEDWSRQQPEQQGLSQEALERAAQRVGHVSWRQCFVVIKGGHLVYEHYYHAFAEVML